VCETGRRESVCLQGLNALVGTQDSSETRETFLDETGVNFLIQIKSSAIPKLSLLLRFMVASPDKIIRQRHAGLSYLQVSD
jgi:hypothetical protein